MANARPKDGETVEQARLRYNAEQRAYRALRKSQGRPLTKHTREQVRDHGWWKKYRLRPEQVFSMWETQNRACAICYTALEQPGDSLHTHIDHCHSTGKVRGILCNHCNLILGHAKDSVSVLESAIRYLTP